MDGKHRGTPVPYAVFNVNGEKSYLLGEPLKAEMPAQVNLFSRVLTCARANLRTGALTWLLDNAAPLILRSSRR